MEKEYLVIKSKIIFAIAIISTLILIILFVYLRFFSERSQYNSYNKIGNDTVDNNIANGDLMNFRSITASDARVHIEGDSSIILLDVRTREENEEIRIPNSILIPVNELETRALNELRDRQARIFIYCRSGVRSITAAEILVSLGYENVYNLGGIINWKYETE